MPQRGNGSELKTKQYDFFFSITDGLRGKQAMTHVTKSTNYIMSARFCSSIFKGLFQKRFITML